jgi:hypothetical protein
MLSLSSSLQIIASQLSRVMLIAIEVAVEYWLALTWSPQAQWLSEVSKSGVIQDEVSPVPCICAGMFMLE